jgi:Flp pilus assembly protein TadD
MKKLRGQAMNPNAIRAAIAALVAIAASPVMAEVGYSEGALAVSALERGNVAQAERVLAPVSLADAHDPARLINLAAVYARTGRVTEARAALLKVSRVADTMLVMSDGAERSSRAIARDALAKVDVEFASR